MSIIENARNRQAEQQFVPAREGLAGYYGDESGYRQANAIRPMPQPSLPRMPNRVLNPEQTRALQAQEEMEMQRQQQLRQGTINEMNRPRYIGR